MRSGILLAVVLGGTSGVVADTIHVPGDFPTIQEAIDAATDGDEVEVHPGIYNENIDFLGKAITVRSTDPMNPNATIIAGPGGKRPYHVVRCDSGEGSGAVLSGFRITGGNAIDSDYDFDRGGGMFIKGSSPTVTYCTFANNIANLGGGGMYIENGSPLIEHCLFIGNVVGGVGAGGSGGGGMWNRSSSPTVRDCTFMANTANGGGGGMKNWESSNPTVTNCFFIQNHSGSWGAGMDSSASSSPIVTCSVFIGNVSNNNGGGLANGDGASTVIDCTFIENMGVDTGGGVFLSSGVGDSLIERCTFIGNSVGIFGGGLYIGGPTWPVDVIDCTFTENFAGVAGVIYMNAVQNNTVYIAGSTLCNNSPNTIVGNWTDGGNWITETCSSCLYVDIDRDGSVGVSDLLILLAAWGTCASGDVTGDGITGVVDFLELLANWGPCP